MLCSDELGGESRRVSAGTGGSAEEMSESVSGLLELANQELRLLRRFCEGVRLRLRRRLWRLLLSAVVGRTGSLVEMAVPGRAVVSPSLNLELVRAWPGRAVRLLPEILEAGCAGRAFVRTGIGGRAGTGSVVDDLPPNQLLRLVTVCSLFVRDKLKPRLRLLVLTSGAGAAVRSCELLPSSYIDLFAWSIGSAGTAGTSLSAPAEPPK